VTVDSAVAAVVTVMAVGAEAPDTAAAGVVEVDTVAAVVMVEVAAMEAGVA